MLFLTVASLPWWSALPFICLLALIVIAPLLMSNFWHHYYKHIAIVMGLGVVTYFAIGLRDWHTPVETLVEYLSFVIFLGALFVAAGGIYIHADFRVTPKVNVFFLFFGAVLSNIIGTTGAAMLLVRPFIRLNKYKIAPYHLVFFIFIVCNVGGALTPIGDPPLFLGYLKGVPFLFTGIHLIGYWLLAICLLLGVFYVLELKNKLTEEADDIKASNKVLVNGKRNIIWLGVIIGAVFLDPNFYDWLPYIDLDGHKVSFLREMIQLTAAVACYFSASKTAMNSNGFEFEPILEVVFLFFGLFFTMMPALKLVASFAVTPEGQQLFTTSSMYWASGFFSSFLDNAPTYMNFLTAAMAKFGKDINAPSEVVAFATGENLLYVVSISLGSVFFGAMTYIGNGPNLMVKSIAEHLEVKMPSFIAYITKYSLVYLLPVLCIVYFVMWLYS
jgi:Na+/H+ antiporter NhaD/arsenite permease-like protein